MIVFLLVIMQTTQHMNHEYHSYMLHGMQVTNFSKDIPVVVTPLLYTECTLDKREIAENAIIEYDKCIICK